MPHAKKIVHVNGCLVPDLGRTSTDENFAVINFGKWTRAWQNVVAAWLILHLSRGVVT